MLDNCEHLLDGVVVLLERLLAGSPRLDGARDQPGQVAGALRAGVPGARAVDRGGRRWPGRRGRAVPGAGSGRRESGDAPTTRERIAAVCRALDGMALAIELAAARYPSLGLDGLEAGLADRLRLLTGGPRIDDRHRSLRSTLDWSYALLAEPDQAVLRRVSVFADPFTATAAAAVLAGWPPVPAGSRSDHPGRARRPEPADRDRRSRAGPATAPWRRSASTASTGSTRRASRSRRGRGTCGGAWTGALPSSVASREADGAWRAAFDQVADELRGALAWAAGDPRYRPEAYRLAIGLAELSFIRGMPGESQRRYEQAAELAADDRAAADALRSAAGAAESRHFGNEALRLRQRAADAAIRAGDRAGAAGDLARNAELINRGPGLMATEPAAGEAAGADRRGLGAGRRRPRPRRRGCSPPRRSTARSPIRPPLDTRRARDRAGPPRRRSADRERRARPAHRDAAGSGRGPRRGGQRVAAHRAAGADAGDGRRRRWSSSTG